MESRPAHLPPDGGWGWIIVFASFLNMILLTSSFFSFGVLFVELVEVMNVSTSRMALLGSIQAALAFGFSVVSGALIHKFGNRPVAILGSLMTSVGLVLSSLAQTISALYITYGLISGIGLSLALPPTQVIVQQYFDRRRVMAGGFVICGMSVGSLISAPILRLLIDFYGWRGALLLHSGIILHGVILASSFRPLPKPPDKNNIYTPPTGESLTGNDYVSRGNDKNMAGKEADTTIATKHPHVDNSVALESSDIEIVEQKSCCLGVFHKIFFEFFDCTLLKDRGFLLFTFGTFFLCFGAMTYPQHQVNFAVHLGAKKDVAAFAPTMVGIFSLISRFLFSLVSNLPCVNRTLQYGVTTFLMGIVLCLACLARNFLHVAILCGLFGFCIGAIEAIKPSVLVDIIGVERISNAFGLICLVTGIAIILGSPLAGFLKDQTGSYSVPFIVLGCIVSLGGILVMVDAIMHRTTHRGRKLPEEPETPNMMALTSKNPNLQKSLIQLNKSMSVSMSSLH